MNNIIDMFQGELREYKSRKLFGIFLLGKRVRMKSGSYTWQDYNDAKKALYYLVRTIKGYQYYLDRYLITEEQMKDLSVNKLLSDGIFEIKEVGNT